MNPPDIEMVERYLDAEVAPTATIVGHVPIVVGSERAMIQGFEHFPEEVRQELDSLCAYRMEGSWYRMANSPVKWDGKTHKLTETGSFPNGLTIRIKRALEAKGCYVPIHSRKKEPPRLGITPEPAFPLRFYQTEALDTYFALEAPHKGIIESPPRSGKTIIAAEAVRRMDQAKVVFLCERLDIAQPPRGAVQKFRDYLGADYGIGWAYDGEFVPGRVVVATIQTASVALGIKEKRQHGGQREKHLTEEQRQSFAQYLREATAIIVDECHHAAAESYRAVLAECKSAYWTLGLSGTAFRDDGADMEMEAAVGPVVHHIEETTLIDQGLLVPCDVLIVQLGLVRYTRNDGYADRRLDYVMRNPVRNQAIVEFCRHMSDMGRSVIVVADYTKHVELLHNVMTLYGIDHQVMMASGKFGVTGKKRPEMWNALNEKRCKVLITTLANEGIDIPSLDAVVIAGGGESAVRTLQRVRCSTAYPGKKRCTILDFADKAKHFSQHFGERLRTYESKGTKVFNIHYVTRFATMKPADVSDIMKQAVATTGVDDNDETQEA